MDPVILFVLFALVAAVGAYVSWHLREKRRKELRVVARQLGLDYSAHDVFGLMVGPFSLFLRGDGRRFENVLSGTWQGVDLNEFDYSYYEESSDSQGHRTKTWYHFSCILTELDLACPHLSIERQNLLTRLANGLGFHDIQFELEDFNRAFNVRSKDRKFANDLLDARMMQWLTGAGDGWGFEILGRWLLTYCKRRGPFELVPLLGTAKGFHEHVPRVVHELYRLPAAG